KFKVTLLLIVSLLSITTLSIFLVYKHTLDSQFQELRNRLMAIAQTAVLAIDVDTLLEVPLNKEGINSPQYKVIADKLKAVKEANLSVWYIYIMAKTEREGVWQFVVDPFPSGRMGRKAVVTSYPGDRYEAGRFPGMLKGFSGPSADKKLEQDEWGITLSGYAPIRDKNGSPVAVLGVDITADSVYLTQKEIERRAVFVLIVGMIISLALGTFISAKVAHPVEKLREATSRIASGSLEYRVQISGRDEIGELARAFNKMAGDLDESRGKLMDYFYRTVQSFVRILEAKHQYTRGHSERVADYAQKVALKMGLSAEKVKLLGEIAILHDIGKIGVQESILNKPGKLTESEWAEIRRHPLIGEDILKPIILNEEMLAIVRGHHERYDSNGYPDKIGAGSINTFAAIVSVADAYDAMTSSRSYRQALSRPEAIEEIRENRGRQFNPEIVDVFLEVLNEEKI
ncbi:MAG TPA: HD-GYP domain-containing protein, partial [Candidatus Omnitrophota bacterium]|nr:HD-GYP domain-containing protein [Candidatus Omnitrophota bacterium]